jgi:hypothetical protein
MLSQDAADCLALANTAILMRTGKDIALTANRKCLLVAAKRTSQRPKLTSANDPKETFIVVGRDLETSLPSRTSHQ